MSTRGQIALEAMIALMLFFAFLAMLLSVQVDVVEKYGDADFREIRLEEGLEAHGKGRSYGNKTSKMSFLRWFGRGGASCSQ